MVPASYVDAAALNVTVSGDVPLVGDWNHTATSKVGVFRPSAGTFYLDYNGNGVWDGCAVIGSFLPALLLGVAFANIFQGIPIDEDGVFQGTLFTLLNPYGLLGGLLIAIQAPLSGMLADVRPDVFATGLGGAALTILAIVTLCAWYPSRLASSVEPSEALHYE